MNRLLTAPGSALLFMKVGVHAQESLEDIIERKQREFDESGSIFWGYGGGTCHPLTMVQPFARQQVERGQEIFLVMEKIDSHHYAEPKEAEEYSDDGVTWQKVPSGIHVLGSRYALVLDQLRFDEFDLNLREARVAVGPTRGRLAIDYMKGHVDKGCFEINPAVAGAPVANTDIKHISLYAKVKAPYAVFLR